MSSIKLQAKRERAIARQTKYSALTIDQKIAIAEQRGGSTRELERLRDKKIKQTIKEKE